MSDRRSPAALKAAAAWSVHVFTAVGAVVAVLALMAIESGQPRVALLWLFVAMLIDGIDGTLARAADVRRHASRIDGDALDLVVDYLSYVFVPVCFILAEGVLPSALALPLCAAILVSSLYVFARRDMKTKDGYFRGFPALWNVVVFYLFLLKLAAPLAAATVAGLVIMTFAPIHVIHPFRTRDFRPLPAILTVVWMSSTAATLLPSLEIGPALTAVSMACAATLVALGLIRTARGPRSTD